MSLSGEDGDKVILILAKSVSVSVPVLSPMFLSFLSGVVEDKDKDKDEDEDEDEGGLLSFCLSCLSGEEDLECERDWDWDWDWDWD